MCPGGPGEAQTGAEQPRHPGSPFPVLTLPSFLPQSAGWAAPTHCVNTASRVSTPLWVPRSLPGTPSCSTHRPYPSSLHAAGHVKVSSPGSPFSSQSQTMTLSFSVCLSHQRGSTWDSHHWWPFLQVCLKGCYSDCVEGSAGYQSWAIFTISSVKHTHKIRRMEAMNPILQGSRS